MTNSIKKIQEQLEFQNNPYVQLSVIQDLQKQAIHTQRTLTLLADKVKALIDGGLPAAMAVTASRNKLTDFEMDIVEEFECAIADLQKNKPGHRFFRLEEIQKKLHQIAYDFNLSGRVLLSILKRCGCQYRNSKCRWYGIPAEIKAYKANSSLSFDQDTADT